MYTTEQDVGTPPVVEGDMYQHFDSEHVFAENDDLKIMKNYRLDVFHTDQEQAVERCLQCSVHHPPVHSIYKSPALKKHSDAQVCAQKRDP